MHREKREKGILRAMQEFDPESYLDSGSMPDHAPPEFSSFVDCLANEMKRRYFSEMLQKQISYVALQNQINPHFLYNTLEAIRSEALSAGTPGIAEMTEKVSRYYRYSISSREDIVTIRDEFSNMEDYFYIQQYRFGNRFRMEKEIEDSEILRNIVPKLSLQPLVENAIVHGLEQKKTGTVRVRAFMTDSKIYIVVSDDGIGMSQEKTDALNASLKNLATMAEATSGKGIALRNVNARLRLCFGEEYGIRVSSAPGCGTDVEALIPRMTEFNRAAFRWEEKEQP